MAVEKAHESDTVSELQPAQGPEAALQVSASQCAGDSCVKL